MHSLDNAVISLNAIETSNEQVTYINQTIKQLMTSLSRNIISLGNSGNPQYVRISLICHEIVEDISSNRTRKSSSEARRAEYAQLLILTNELLKRDRQDHVINNIALNLVENDQRKNQSWKKLGVAVLAVTGALLILAGTLALCSGIGVLPGGFLAAAGAWLTGITGLTAGSTFGTVISAGVMATGTVSLFGATFGTFGMFRRSGSRENLKSSICDITAKPGCR